MIYATNGDREPKLPVRDLMQKNLAVYAMSLAGVPHVDRRRAQSDELARARSSARPGAPRNPARVRTAHDRRLGLRQAAGNRVGANAVRGHLDQGAERGQAEGRDDLSVEMGAGRNLTDAPAPGDRTDLRIEGSFYDHDGICRAGEFVWRRVISVFGRRWDQTNTFVPSSISTTRQGGPPMPRKSAR
jgi:hypothetical protein